MTNYQRRHRTYDAGVYMIRSLKNGESYIGASCKVTARLQDHLWTLLKGTHILPKLRKAFAGHKMAEIETRIIERVEVRGRQGYSVYDDPFAWEGRMKLLERERHWIRELNPSLNQIGRHRLEHADIANGPPERRSRQPQSAA